MIARLWHGWTRPENAEKYQNLLQSHILPGIHRVTGYNGAWLMRRDVGNEVEFITVTLWQNWDAIREFSGPAGHAVVPDEARKLLSRFDEESTHYDGAWVP